MASRIVPEAVISEQLITQVSACWKRFEEQSE